MGVAVFRNLSSNPYIIGIADVAAYPCLKIVACVLFGFSHCLVADWASHKEYLPAYYPIGGATFYAGRDPPVTSGVT